MSETGRPCRYCKGRVLDVIDAYGKAQVLDVRAPVYTIGTAHLALRVEGYYVSHWATCPGRDQAKADQAAKKAQATRE